MTSPPLVPRAMALHALQRLDFRPFSIVVRPFHLASVTPKLDDRIEPFYRDVTCVTPKKRYRVLGFPRASTSGLGKFTPYQSTPGLNHRFRKLSRVLTPGRTRKGFLLVRQKNGSPRHARPAETCTKIHRLIGRPKAVQGGILIRCFAQESQTRRIEFRELHFVFVVARLNLR
jgi:hypothetical protein